jgi:hypothetical protein
LSFACSKPVVAGWIVVVVCLWVCGRCRFWGWWSYCGGYIYFTLHDGRVLLPCASALCLSMLRWFLSKGTARRRDFTLHDGRVLLPCASALCLSMLRWFLSKGTARRRDCASMRDWALCLACFERRCSSARSVKTGAVCRQAKIKRFRVSRGKSRCRDGVPRAHVTRPVWRASSGDVRAPDRSRWVRCGGQPGSSVFEFPEASQDVETGCRGRTSQDV